MPTQNICTAGICIGGTSVLVAVGSSPLEATRYRFASGYPVPTISELARVLGSYPSLAQIGVASFGPIQLDPSANSFGTILESPKVKWSGFRLMDELRRQFVCDIQIDIDTAAGALGEYLFGSSGLDRTCMLYVSIGTGIGGCLAQAGRVFRGSSHLELGHIPVQRHPADSAFAGACPFHGANCLEGLASGSAIAARWGVKPESLSHSHEAWELESWYLGRALYLYDLCYSPTATILSGGVMSVSGLLSKIFRSYQEAACGYHVSSKAELSDRVTVSALGGWEAALGAFAMAAGEAVPRPG
jgi:fructokinase